MQEFSGADVPILFEDSNVLVLNKPAGLLVHPTDHNPSANSLTQIFAHKLIQSDPLRPGVVHRLDKDTSGVVIMAKTEIALRALQAQFKARTVEKIYDALIWGHLQEPKARLELPIRRSLRQPNKMMVHHAGKLANTEYEVVGRYVLYSLLKIKLLTGRTHQIRVQFAHLGHPVVGDPLYSKQKLPRGLTRQFLHAQSLTLTLPTGERKQFTTSMPQDLNSFLRSL